MNSFCFYSEEESIAIFEMDFPPQLPLGSSHVSCKSVIVEPLQGLLEVMSDQAKVKCLLGRTWCSGRWTSLECMRRPQTCITHLIVCSQSCIVISVTFANL